MILKIFTLKRASVFEEGQLGKVTFIKTTNKAFSEERKNGLRYTKKIVDLRFLFSIDFI